MPGEGRRGLRGEFARSRTSWLYLGLYLYLFGPSNYLPQHAVAESDRKSSRSRSSLTIGAGRCVRDVEETFRCDVEEAFRCGRGRCGRNGRRATSGLAQVGCRATDTPIVPIDPLPVESLVIGARQLGQRGSAMAMRRCVHSRQQHAWPQPKRVARGDSSQIMHIFGGGSGLARLISSRREAAICASPHASSTSRMIT